MKRNTLLMILIVCAGIMVMTTGAFAADPVVTLDNGNIRIFANGNAIILAAGTTADHTVVYHDVNNDGVIDDGDRIQIIPVPTGSPDTGGYNLSGYTIFGGKDSGSLAGDTRITMLGGNVSSIYGGGFGSEGSVGGNTYITIKNGILSGMLIGGGYGSVGGNTNITIDSGSFQGAFQNIFGGGFSASSIVNGSTNLTINGGSFGNSVNTGIIYGGGNNSVVDGNTNIIINGGTFKGEIYGGSNAKNVSGSTNITINGGTFTNTISGGGAGGGAVTVDKNIKISGGSITGTVGDYTPNKLTNADGITQVYKTTLTLPGITTPTDVIGTLTLGGPAGTGYSLNGVKTSNTGLLAFYLPEGAATAIYNSVDYTVTVAADHNNAFTPGPQTITFANPGAQNFGTTPTLTATASSGLPVTFTSDTPLVCSISSAGVLTFLSAGTATISANQPGDAAYLPATTVSRTFTVNAVVPGAPTGVAATAGNGQATVTFTAPAFTGGAPITGYTVTSNPVGFTGTGASSPIIVTGLTNGTAYTFTVTATNSAGTGAASPASNSITPKASQTITFDNPGAQNFGTTPTLTATASSVLPVTFTSDTPLVCSITSAGVLTFLSAGTATISANQPGDATYLPATTVSRTFTVNAVVPGSPTGVAATAGNGQATVTFTAPAFTGGAPITGYTVTSNPVGFTGTGASSPITVTGLTNGTSYTFTVTATNSAGTGAASVGSSATPVAAPIGGGGSSSDGDSGSPAPVAPAPTILTDITTPDDQKLETSLQLNGQARIDVSSTGTGQASITGNIINQLFDLQKPLDIAGQGVSLLFGPNALQNPQGNGQNNLGTVQIGATPVSNQEKDALLAAAPLGQSTGVFQIGGQIFNLTAQRSTSANGSTSSARITSFTEPVAVTIDLSGLSLSPEQISQLTGTRLEKNENGEIVPVFLGGTYDAVNNTFTFFTDRFSLYTVLQKNDLVILNLIIDHKVTKKNGADHIIDVPPSLINNRTFVPLRFIGEALGASFEWDSETRTVTFIRGEKTLTLTVGQTIPGMDTAPVIINGRTMVPLRYISESFGAQVMWFPSSRSVCVVKQHQKSISQEVLFFITRQITKM